MNPNTVGSSTRSTRMSTVSPLLNVISASPPGRRSIVALSPNQADSPSGVVIAAHTFAGGWASSMLRSIRSGNAITHLRLV